METRDITSFGVSIGTGLTLETIFTATTSRYDDTREIPQGINVDDYTSHYFNIYTLVRNYLTSYKSIKDKDSLIERKQFITEMIEEIMTINELYIDVEAEFLLYNPSNIRSKQKKYASSKDDSITKGFIEYADLEPYVKKLVKELPDDIKVVNKIAKPGSESIMVFSHYMLDFIDLNDNAYLLESHTGKVKSRKQLNSKYHAIGKRDLSHLPFVDILLYILGDKTLVAKTPISLRQAIYELSVSEKWTPRTTRAKVILDFDKSDFIKEKMLTYSMT